MGVATHPRKAHDP